ncbi:MurR/RpiR family transcriptional regulator [Rhizobium sp. SSA_523]|uniref:MurR/RpiR family transcriptional regulator n=1 Tax=Rhizobium sp. SSA_523 TaxID=2952477 RepID=UPI002091DFE7|nr:MurR/RpiR family transcriptional regulator [Rhizobium sp. SSA_523]MCO5734726.1 MurR/RpiR family transcriptional regulator [Rhizobium sp. SSA_523]WKC22969.1 MurR/RpiR family transcriptional regulator [Rhizobium sp. SSA_523]
MVKGVPASVQEFEERLLAVTASLPKRLKQCADYVAAHSDRIAVSTVAEMAEGAGVQPSAFMRFCQILGFSGYSEMQRLFRDSYVGGWPDYRTRLDHLRDLGEQNGSRLLAEFVEAGRASLENLLKSVDDQMLEAAVETLAEARIVHIVGLRRSFPVASYIAYALEKMQVPAVLHSGTGGLDGACAILPGDALLAITFSPYSAETLALVESVVSRNVPVVALTDATVNPLRKMGATILTVSEVDFGAFRSLSATLCLAIALSTAVGARRTS